MSDVVGDDKTIAVTPSLNKKKRQLEPHESEKTVAVETQTVGKESVGIEAVELGEGKTKVIKRQPITSNKAALDKTVAIAKAGSNQDSSPVDIGVGCTLKDRFYLESVLGVGGMGTVYKAKDLRQEEVGEKSPWLAIKILNSNISQHAFSWGALQRECKKTQQLSHPHIVSVFDFDRDGDTLFMSMEFLDGVSLDEIINKKSFTGWSGENVDRLVSQVGGALSYAHSKGIVHSDLKPSNIFMTRDGDFKVYDFGIARAVHDVSMGDSHQKEEPLVALTPAYASVGMLSEEKAKPADDLYAFGCVIYMAATAKHPYERETALSVLQNEIPLISPKGLPRYKSRALCDILNVANPVVEEVAQFTEEYLSEPAKSSLTSILSVLMAGILIVAVGLYIGGHHERKILKQLKSENVNDVFSAMEEIRQMNSEGRFKFLEQSRSDLIEFYQRKTQQLIQKKSYLSATKVLQEARGFYPDSMTLSVLNDSLHKQHKEAYEGLKLKGVSLLKKGGGERLHLELPAIVASLGHVEGGEKLLAEWQLDQWVAQKINEAMYLGHLKQTELLFDLADTLYPGDKRFGKIYKTFRAIQLSDDHSSRQQGKQEGHPDYIQLQQRGDNAGISSSRDNQQKLMATYQAYIEKNVMASGASEQVSWTHDQIKDFLKQIESTESEWGIALSSGIHHFIGEQHQIYLRDSSSGSKRVAQRYRQLGSHLYPSMSQFSAKKRVVDPCKSWWAGKGRTPSFQCQDSISHRQKGPTLVVVPGTKTIRRFAIMLTELSVADYNVYCRLYQRCKALGGDGNLPVTDISYQDAKRYVSWLSQVTGYTYRFPLIREWQHAVSAKNPKPLNDHNCLLMQGTKIIRGNKLRPVKQGTANNWGLKNGLGNVQEWVYSGGKILRAGGGASTPLSNCRLSYSVALDKSDIAVADATTGIRLVRELK